MNDPRGRHSCRPHAHPPRAITPRTSRKPSSIEPCLAGWRILARSRAHGCHPRDLAASLVEQDATQMQHNVAGARIFLSSGSDPEREEAGGRERATVREIVKADRES